MDVVVIGNGIAGVSAAFTIRKCKENAKVTIISREPTPAYSACALANYLSGERERDRVFIKSIGDYLKEKINIELGDEVEGIDVGQMKIHTGTKKIPYDKLILATGSLPFIPRIDGCSLRGVFALKTMQDADRIIAHRPRKVVVVGSGPIGIEATVALRRIACEIDLIELLDRILPNLFDQEASSLIQSILEEQGVRVHTDEKVLNIIGGDHVRGVTTNKRKIDCDTVIMSVGMIPDTRLVKEMPAMEMGKRGGIRVDKRMKTSIPEIFACGDCVETEDLFSGEVGANMLWHNAKQQGDIAGYNAIGVEKSYPGSFSIAGVDVFGTHAVSVGNTRSYLKDTPCDVIEKHGDHCYYRIVTANGLFKGGQYIGPYEELGMIFTAIKKRDLLEHIQGISRSRKTVLENPWLYRLQRYLK
jgi:NADH oxidase (H2O2-forming)